MSHPAQQRLRALGNSALAFVAGVPSLVLTLLVLMFVGKGTPDKPIETHVVLMFGGGSIALVVTGVVRLRRYRVLARTRADADEGIGSDMALAGRAVLHAVVVMGAAVGIPIVCAWIGLKFGGDEDSGWRGLWILVATTVGLLIGLPLAINIHYRQCPRCWRLSAARLMGTEVLGVTSGHRTEVRRDMVYTPTMHLIARVWREERVAVTDTALRHRLCCRFCSHEWAMRTNVRQDS